MCPKFKTTAIIKTDPCKAEHEHGTHNFFKKYLEIVGKEKSQYDTIGEIMEFKKRENPEKFRNTKKPADFTSQKCNEDYSKNPQKIGHPVSPALKMLIITQSQLSIRKGDRHQPSGDHPVVIPEYLLNENPEYHVRIHPWTKPDLWDRA